MITLILNNKKKTFLFTFYFILFVLLFTTKIAQTKERTNRGISVVTVLDSNGQNICLYEASYALIIGISAYFNGWPNLPGVVEDTEAVRNALIEKDFYVKYILNPDSNNLSKSYKNFIAKYGNNPNNRLLFYFAGHGYTINPKWGDQPRGYIVPSNSPNPSNDLVGFKDTAIPMQRIEEYALSIESKHALFLFDSCFSGTLFSQYRSAPNNISYKTSKPVRQFITAGSADETVPDKSIFRTQFIAGINGLADLNNDNYVTGTELGYFLQSNLINYTKGMQHPQYGKIRNPHLDKGDFVFKILNNQSFVQKQPKQVITDPESEMWAVIKESEKISDYQNYLFAFPDGQFAEMSRIKMNKLKRKNYYSLSTDIFLKKILFSDERSLKEFIWRNDIRGSWHGNRPLHIRLIYAGSKIIGDDPSTSKLSDNKNAKPFEYLGDTVGLNFLLYQSWEKGRLLRLLPKIVDLYGPDTLIELFGDQIFDKVIYILESTWGNNKKLQLGLQFVYETTRLDLRDEELDDSGKFSNKPLEKSLNGVQKFFYRLDKKVPGSRNFVRQKIREYLIHKGISVF